MGGGFLTWVTELTNSIKFVMNGNIKKRGIPGGAEQNKNIIEKLKQALPSRAREEGYWCGSSYLANSPDGGRGGM